MHGMYFTLLHFELKISISQHSLLQERGTSARWLRKVTWPVVTHTNCNYDEIIIDIPKTKCVAAVL